ncbi:optic atrophy 3 protein homolog isoform X1 [Styela clava]|uniref:putative OPA3-like protein CG13603 isoform X1 n=1 Tax=Styela clava TaxID=7725 RepID=UPI00193996FB|nr:putative OPA3-like protein CG13603 isoform X1 [Styela clava]
MSQKAHFGRIQYLYQWQNKLLGSYLGMVLGVPLAKALPLLFKVVTKPMVDSLKRNVRKRGFLKDSVFIPLAHYYNKQSVRTRLWTQGIRRTKEQIEKSSQMSEEAAIELGAEIVANTFTFIIGLLAILMQQSISAATERKKVEAEENILQRIEKNQLELHRKVLELGLDLQKQDTKIRELNRKVLSLPQYGTLPQQHEKTNISKSVEAF